MKKLIILSLVLSISAVVAQAQLPEPAFELATPGAKTVMECLGELKYEKTGTRNFKYEILDLEKLRNDFGEGIHPNESVLKDPLYQKALTSGKLEGSHWNYIEHENKALAFYKWATAAEENGVKQFFTAQALANAGHIHQAIKAYYSVLIFWNKSACWSADGSFVWYVAPASIGAINNLTRQYPEVGYRLEGAFCEIINAKDIDLTNDTIFMALGEFVMVNPNKSKPDLTTMKVIEKRGEGKVHFNKYENGHWQMVVNDAPYVVKGVTYSPTKIGESPHIGTMRNWQFVDDNGNGKCDAAYEAYLDTDGDNKFSAKTETRGGDFKIMKDMGCNAIRLYNKPDGSKYTSAKSVNKELLRDMNNTYGIKAIMGDFLGSYTVGLAGMGVKYTDYTNGLQKAKLKEIVKQFVLDNKDEDYVLVWLLGNENNMPAGEGGVNGTNTNASSQPQAWAEFLNEVAAMIHEIDPDHPVGIGNQEVGLLDYYTKYAPELDFIGLNLYRGASGFGDVWQYVRRTMDRPILITEYGFPAIKDGKLNEEYQAKYNKGCWEDIEANFAGNHYEGNSIGGVVFEYLDEWWKSSYSGGWHTHGDGVDPAGEYYGVLGQGKGSDSPYLRELRPVYEYYKAVWNK